MPRANRYVLSGYIYHLTHRCHDRRFLLRFARDRNQYRQRLREAVLRTKVSLLDYIVTCNHVHLIVYAEDPGQVAGMMQKAAGEFARDYNRRKGRSGAFWEGRYFATMVEGGQYLWRCLRYVEMNMVRCGVVQHPRQWPWSGYEEMMGSKKRNRLLDVSKLLWLLRTDDVDAFRRNLDLALEEAITKRVLMREPMWTEALAVGGAAFVADMEGRIRNRQVTETVEESGTWVLREECEREYGALSGPGNRAIGAFAISPLL